jgi:hypothetical protein
MEKKEENQIVMSQQMRAVMTIVSACSDIKQYAGPHIDVTLDQINWDLIFKVRWTTSQKTALAWAFALWRDDLPPKKWTQISRCERQSFVIDGTHVIQG